MEVQGAVRCAKDKLIIPLLGKEYKARAGLKWQAEVDCDTWCMC